MSPKKIAQRSLTGQKGVNLVERILLQMGYVWRSLTVLDSGVDGTIELRDPVSEAVTNIHLQVQIKTLTPPFPAETSDGFDYTCRPEDVEYWLQGNMPVILIVASAADDRAYWMPIKEYFKDLATRKARKIHFDKDLHRFDANCASELAHLAGPADRGIYFAPPPRHERLYSNLLTITAYPKHIHVAETAYRDYEQLRFDLEAFGHQGKKVWLLKGGQIISFYDLEEPPWDRICDRGTHETFETAEWAEANDHDRQHEFTQLLNYTLREISWGLGLKYDKGQKCYYFRSDRGLKQRSIQYLSLAHRNTHRTIFAGYPLNRPPDHKPSYYRHSAFRGQFTHLEGKWYLEITPTYHFTWDGLKPDEFAGEHLQKIKQLERNPAILGQVVMWARYLTRTGDLFQSNTLLRFGDLVDFSLEAGIDDDSWLADEVEGEAELLDTSADSDRLF